MPKIKKATIYDIATQTKISASTVAAVLNGSWKKRRIAEKTALLIKKVARKKGYSINLQARGLRKSKSGLIGMIVPMLDNRFFSSLAESFEALARAEGLYPVVVSTLRNPQSERDTVEALISHNIEALFLAGATDPDSLSDICKRAGVKHVNVDLPGTKALSVISDNFNGAKDLSTKIIENVGANQVTRSFHFIGGIASDHNTLRRIEGFKEALKNCGLKVVDDQIHACGYDATLAEAAVRSLYLELGGLPSGLFVNSTISFEGVVRFLKTLPVEEVCNCSIGCFDWDPYIELLHFPVMMIKQDVGQMINEAYRLLGSKKQIGENTHLIPTIFIPAAIAN